MWFCDKISDTGLVHLGAMPNLHSLNLSACPNVTDAGLGCLRDVRTLRSLSLSSCQNVTDAGLVELGKLHALESLILSHCQGITDNGLAQLGRLTRLRFLDLSGCDQITKAGVNATLSSALPNCKIKHPHVDSDDDGDERDDAGSELVADESFVATAREVLLASSRRLTRFIELNAPLQSVEFEVANLVPRLAALYGPTVLNAVIGSLAYAERNRLGFCRVEGCGGRITTDTGRAEGLCDACSSKARQDQAEHNARYPLDEELDS